MNYGGSAKGVPATKSTGFTKVIPNYTFYTVPGVGKAGKAGAPYGKAASPYGKPAAPYGKAGAPYGKAAAPYGKPAAPYGKPAAPYGKAAAPYGKAAAPYGKPAAATAPTIPYTKSAGWQTAIPATTVATSPVPGGWGAI